MKRNYKKLEIARKGRIRKLPLDIYRLARNPDGSYRDTSREREHYKLMISDYDDGGI